MPSMTPKARGRIPSSRTRYIGRMLATISDETSVSRLVMPRAQTVRWTTGTSDWRRAALLSVETTGPVRDGRVSRPAQSIAYIKVSQRRGEPRGEARSPPPVRGVCQHLRRLWRRSLPQPALMSGAPQTFHVPSPSAHDDRRGGLEKESAGGFRAVNRRHPDVDDGRLGSAAGAVKDMVVVEPLDLVVNRSDFGGDRVFLPRRQIENVETPGREVAANAFLEGETPVVWRDRRALDVLAKHGQ